MDSEKSRLYIAFFYVHTTGAEQHTACSQSEVDHFNISVELLTTIAQTCDSPEIASLFYKRAQLRELMEEYDSFNTMLDADRSSQAYLESYRILIGLVEAFAAEALSRRDRTTLSRLHKTYDHYIEIAEVWFKGYDLIANRMEREQQF